MSGGRFDYLQDRIEDIAKAIDELIESNDGLRQYSSETISRFREAAHTLRRAREMAQRVDWLVSGDDGEGCFHSRWKDEVRDAFCE